MIDDLVASENFDRAALEETLRDLVQRELAWEDPADNRAGIEDAVRRAVIAGNRAQELGGGT